jgi:hypothetical protein
MSTSTKIIIGAVIAVVALGITCVGGIFAFGIWIANNVPEGIVLNFDYPDDVVVGDEFDVTITVQNLLDTSRTLTDLDFYEPVLDGVSIVSFDPQPATDESMNVFGSRTVSFNRMIPAQSELVLVVTMTADEAGYFTGDVDVSIDGILSIYSTTQTIVILEPEN